MTISQRIFTILSEEGFVPLDFQLLIAAGEIPVYSDNSFCESFFSRNNAEESEYHAFPSDPDEHLLLQLFHKLSPMDKGRIIGQLEQKLAEK